VHPLLRYPEDLGDLRDADEVPRHGSTVPPEYGAKYWQELLFGSEKWQTVYSTLRNSVEGLNGFVKDGAHEALPYPERRRVGGVAAQSVFVPFSWRRPTCERSGPSWQNSQHGRPES
jgi:hypothetical protein